LNARALGGAHLLEIEPEFGEGLAPDDLEEATRRVRLPTFSISSRSWDVRDVRTWEGVTGAVIGIVVIDGGVLMHVCVAGRWCSRWLGAGELVLLDGVEVDSVPMRWKWSAVPGTHIAVLDEHFTAAARRWPSLLTAAFRRAALNARNAFVQQAFGQLPRVEDRILAFLWSMADRYGRVHADGVHVRLALTHGELGRMIGARRSTVSIGIKRLTEDGFLSHDDGEWWLSQDSLDHFRDLDADGPALAAGSSRDGSGRMRGPVG